MKPPNERTDPWSLGHRVWYAALTVYSLLLIAMTFVHPTLWQLNSTELIGASQIKESLASYFWYAPFAVTVVVLLMSVKGVFVEVRWPSLVGLCLVLIVLPYSCMSRFGRSLAPWTTHGIYKDDNGQKFVFLDSSFLQGQTMALGVVEPEGLLYRHYRILGSTNGDSPRRYATMVRTGQGSCGYGCLVPTPDGRLLLGFRYDNKCYFAYEFTTGSFKRWDDIEKLTPFALADANSKLDMGDVESLQKRSDEYAAHNSKLPWADALVEAKTHHNSEVRAVAEKYCARYGLTDRVDAIVNSGE